MPTRFLSVPLSALAREGYSAEEAVLVVVVARTVVVAHTVVVAVGIAAVAVVVAARIVAAPSSKDSGRSFLPHSPPCSCP